MSRRVVRRLLARIDDLETELANVKHDRSKLIALDMWKEELCRLMQPTDS